MISMVWYFKSSKYMELDHYKIWNYIEIVIPVFQEDLQRSMHCLDSSSLLEIKDIPTKSYTMKLKCHWFFQWQWSKINTKWTMRGACCNATITWQKTLSITGGATMDKWPRCPFHRFQPRTLKHLVFAVPLKYLISIDSLSNAPSCTTGVLNHHLCSGDVNGVVYRDILGNTVVSFARQHFGDNCRYQNNNATAHRS